MTLVFLVLLVVRMNLVFLVILMDRMTVVFLLMPLPLHYLVGLEYRNLLV